MLGTEDREGQGTARFIRGLCIKQCLTTVQPSPWRRTVCPLNHGHLIALGEGSLLKPGSEREDLSVGAERRDCTGKGDSLCKGPAAEISKDIKTGVARLEW